LFGQVEDGAESVGTASFGDGVGEELVGFHGLILGAEGAEAVKAVASCLAQGVGYGKGHVGVLVKIGCYVYAGFLYEDA
jgi:hypothetical protein